MNFQMLNLIGDILLSLCGFFFALTIFLFFRFGIVAVIGDLTGRTAKKAIEQIRLNNLKTGPKEYKTSIINKSRGIITEKISPSGHLKKRQTGKLINTEDLSRPQAQASSMDTFEQPKISVEADNTKETTVLSTNETTVLRTPEPTFPVQYVDKRYFFNIEKDYMYINTSEEI